jgi:hypothetical protein
MKTLSLQECKDEVARKKGTTTLWWFLDEAAEMYASQFKPTERVNHEWLQVFKPPFRYLPARQTIVDADGSMCLDVRGWGRAQCLPKGSEMQDAFGTFVASLLNQTLSDSI